MSFCVIDTLFIIKCEIWKKNENSLHIWGHIFAEPVIAHVFAYTIDKCQIIVSNSAINSSFKCIRNTSAFWLRIFKIVLHDVVTFH